MLAQLLYSNTCYDLLYAELIFLPPITQNVLQMQALILLSLASVKLPAVVRNIVVGSTVVGYAAVLVEPAVEGNMVGKCHIRTVSSRRDCYCSRISNSKKNKVRDTSYVSKTYISHSTILKVLASMIYLELGKIVYQVAGLYM